MIHRETLQAMQNYNMQKKKSRLGTSFALSVRLCSVMLSSSRELLSCDDVKHVML
jgi:hypothetical protein